VPAEDRGWLGRQLGRLAGREPKGDLGRRRASGIYGTIITAAIIDTAGGHVTTTQLVVAVFVTLVVYWAAEQYAELLGEHTQEGRLPRWPAVRAALAASWPMVAASYMPLLVLVVVRLAGASDSGAAWAGVIAALVLLVYHGWAAARAASLQGKSLLAATLMAAGLGVVMILLKELVLLHLH
jgi:hypothetical protein